MAIKKTALSLALGTAFAASLAASPIVNAAESPFAMQSLDKGYMVAEAGEKAKEGKCGGEKADAMKAKEGKCGGTKDAKDAKAKDGKCGGAMEKDAAAGKMKDGKCGSKPKMKDGKCGEGKCGANKAKPEEKK